MAYFSYNTDNGQLLQISDYEIHSAEAENYTISNIDATKAALENEYDWDVGLREFHLKKKDCLSKLEFLRRFTTAERIAIREIAKIDPIVFDAMELVNMAEFICLTDPDTQNLVGYLAMQGVIQPNRVSVILSM